jgi:prepilin-type N-terminal cleavage/methylation domain-containing protein
MIAAPSTDPRAGASTAESGACCRAGFSIVEVMIAMLVLGVGVVGVAEGIGTAVRSSREAQVHSAAALFAEGLIETLRAEGYLTDGVTEGECPTGLDAHRWRRTISPTELAGLHDVEVVIERQAGGGPVFALRTLLFEVPSDSPPRDRERQRERDAGARRREQRGGGR